MFDQLSFLAVEASGEASSMPRTPGVDTVLSSLVVMRGFIVCSILVSMLDDERGQEARSGLP